MARATIRSLTSLALIFTCALPPAFAKDSLPPRIIQEPVFGLQYEIAKAKFDILPSEVPPKCLEYAGLENPGIGRLFIFASAQNASQTYYVVGGYWKPRSAADPQSRYELDKFGGIILVDGEGCVGFGQARDVFNARYFEEIPQAVLQQLANDLAARLARAAGSLDRLRA